jgi:hypothetical protein
MNDKTKPFVAPMSADELRAEAERLLREGRMPSLEELSRAVLAARRGYSTKIRRARREASEKAAVN